MRYIDADKLILNLSDYELQESPNWGANGHGNKDAYEAIHNCIESVESQPTADVVPLKDYQSMERTCKKLQDRLADVRENVRGQWLDYCDNPIKFYSDGRYSAHCSVCGYSPEYEEEMRSANFCPNCGADMRQVTGKLE